MDYLIAYDYQQLGYSGEQLHETIINLPISDWWHYVPGIYIVSSEHTEKTLADGIIVRNPGLIFLIVKIDLSKANGVLNKSAWDWINSKANKLLRLKPAASPNIQPNELTQILGFSKIIKTTTASTSQTGNQTLINIFKRQQ